MASDESAIHDRLDRQGDKLDKQDEKLDRIVEAVTRQVAICEPSRDRLEKVCRVVYGNNGDGLKGKVKGLETVRKIRSKGFWVLVVCFLTVVSGTILTIGQAVLAAMKG